MKGRRFVNGIFGIAVALAALTGERAFAADGPSFTVVDGSVQIQYPSGAQSPAVVNGTVSPGVYVTTGAGARAEIRLDDTTMLRLGEGVQARLTGSNASDRHLQLAAGTVEVSILRGGDRTVEIDSPSLTVRAKDAGAYRITVASNGQTSVTARRGHAEVVTPDQTYSVDRGKTLVAAGAASHPQISYTADTAYDAFDTFNAQRDDAVDNALAQDSNYSYDGSSYYSASYVQPVAVAPACTYAPLGIGYYGYGWGASVLGGYAGGCSAYTTAWLTPYWGWPYYSPYWYQPYYNVGYWPPYPYPYGYGYPYRPLPPPPPPRHRPIRGPIRMYPQPVVVAAPRVAQAPVRAVVAAPVHTVVTAPAPRVAEAPVHAIVAAPVHVTRTPVHLASTPVHVVRTPVHVVRTPVRVAGTPVHVVSTPVRETPREPVARRDGPVTPARAAWERFDSARGTDVSRSLAPDTAAHSDAVSHENVTGAATNGRDTSSSWDRFTQTRGSVAPPAIDEPRDVDGPVMRASYPSGMSGGAPHVSAPSMSGGAPRVSAPSMSGGAPRVSAPSMPSAPLAGGSIPHAGGSAPHVSGGRPPR